jgi:hypothetical protein
MHSHLVQCSNSNFMISSRCSPDTTFNGVLPSSSCTSTDAPYLISGGITLILPSCDARCNGVELSPAGIRICTVVKQQSNNSGVVQTTYHSKVYILLDLLPPCPLPSRLSTSFPLPPRASQRPKPPHIFPVALTEPPGRGGKSPKSRTLGMPNFWSSTSSTSSVVAGSSPRTTS